MVVPVAMSPSNHRASHCVPLMERYQMIFMSYLKSLQTVITSVNKLIFETNSPSWMIYQSLQ